MRTLTVLLGVLFVVGSADSESFMNKLRYGIDMVRQLLEAESSLGEVFRRVLPDAGDWGSNFAGDLFEAVLGSIAGNRDEIVAAGVRMSMLVAKMISDSFPLYGSRQSRSSEAEFSPLNTLLRQTQIQELLTELRDPNLIDKMLQEETNNPRVGDCVRLLACKLIPIVRGMQASVDFFLGRPDSDDRTARLWSKATPHERFFLFLPRMEEFTKNGDTCDERHPLCVY